MQCYVRNFEGMPVRGLLFAKAIQNIQEKGIRPKGGFKNSLALHSKCFDHKNSSPRTGGPPLTRKSLTRFPLTQFLSYIGVSGGISVSRGPQYSPTYTNFM